MSRWAHNTLLLALLLAGAPTTQAQTASLAGRVTDASGLALPGVNVVIEGTGQGTATGVDGRYLIERLQVGPVTVAASIIGYERQRRDTVLSAGGNVLDFVMQEDVILTDGVIVTASRRPQAVLEAPASVAVLTPRELESRNIVAIDDALRYIPGVNVQENQVNVRGSSGFAYNTGSRVLMLIDGMPLLTPDSDGMPFDALPVAQIERIEVLKGPGSALYGGGALGGVINVITRDVGDEPRTQVSAFAGAHAPVRYDIWTRGFAKGGEFRPYLGFAASHARKLSESLGGWLNVSVRRDDGYLNFNRASYLQGFGKLNWKPNPETTGELLVGLLVREKDNFLFWNGARDALNPGSLAIGSQDPGGTPTGTNDIFANQLTLLPSYTRLVGDKLYLAARGRVFGTVLRPLDDEGNVESLDNGTLGIRWGGELQVDYAASDSRNLTFGASGDAMASRSTFFVTADGDSTGAQPETALFTQWEEQLGRTTISAGMRLDRYAIDTGSTVQRLSPKLGVSHLLAEGASVRAAWGHGFRVPSLAERFTDNQDFFPIVRNPGLLPERSVSVEVGLRDERTTGFASLQTDLAVFVSDYWDLIEPRLVPELRAFQFINLTRARISGVELAFEAAADRGILRVGYTLLDAEDRTVNEPLASRSRHQLTAGVELPVARGFRAAADVRTMSAPERVDSDFALFVRDADLLVPMRVLDLRVMYQRGAMRASLLLNNALDYYYLERPAFLAPPRHLTARVQLDF
ncbi:MAG: TonB-dependent receptor [Rhodothermales bacterium]|nr:TonB-dependent receptor [Rhodothermales bacterium]MBO6779678.1 TonB-dependent receptor [Rhodothermales bacterium]